ncbi:hypothetical protein [Psychrobacillus soli]|uniref:Uncharacterized protein n=1 Tax=Psychrobacillus soli TaxID=1543965 RepID=A0A544TN43_9BACI|nr:hypothetical protein [Psychrobacillus soli]TQR18871.1 hypothetical protein FG383_00905 [Psychrobacillus soli]
MMFLSNSTLGEVVWTQLKFKMNAYLGAVVSLIFVQIIGLIVSMNGNSSTGSGVDNTSFTIITISSDVVFAFVGIWAVFVGKLFTTKAYRYDDFSFVATRLSSNLANFSVLCLMSIFAGVTTFLSNYILRVVLLLVSDVDYVKSVSIFEDPIGTIVNLSIMIILILTISAGGYLWGMLVQIHKAFTYLLILLIITLLVTKTGQTILQYVFIENESIVFLIVKLIALSLVFFLLAILCSNRLEVRR